MILKTKKTLTLTQGQGRYRSKGQNRSLRITRLKLSYRVVTKIIM